MQMVGLSIKDESHLCQQETGDGWQYTSVPPHFAGTNFRHGVLQIVGFFIVEERMQASFGDEGVEGWQGSSGWEAAQASLKSQLEAACAAIQEPAPLRSLKDFALLSCIALGTACSLCLIETTCILKDIDCAGLHCTG